MQHLQLSELTYKIEQGLQKALPDEYWVVGEISECSKNSKGHCYLELIEKPEQSETIIAKIRATIWSSNFRLIDAYFKSSTGIELQAGLKVLVKASVEFHSLYGISLNIVDIDPVYTIGEDEKQRRDIIERLYSEGIADMNKELELPLVPQRIAVVSSSQAAGYQDFIEQLSHNSYNISFQTTLFHAAMQGIEVEQDIIQALDKIYENEQDFDAVVIIRGGGSKTDLRWFDNYRIAANITQFPLPVIAGIGHDKDQSIVDLVAHTSLKTPTAVAEFLISRGVTVLLQLQDLQQQLETATIETIENEKEEIQYNAERISNVFQRVMLKTEAQLEQKKQIIKSQTQLFFEKESNKLKHSEQNMRSSIRMQIQKKNNNVDLLHQRIEHGISSYLQKQKQSIQLFETKVTLHNPQIILAKGFSITTNSIGETITSKKQVKKGEMITTFVTDGNFKSISE